MFERRTNREKPSVNISIPKGWDSLTTEQLEAVCSILIDDAHRPAAAVGDVRPRVFFALSGLRLASNLHHEDGEGNDWYEVEFSSSSDRKARQQVNGAEASIRMNMYTLSQAVDKLAWLMKPCTLTRFPYPTYKARGTRRGEEVIFEGPSPLMQDWTWRQYRFACDYVSALIAAENRLVAMRKSSIRFGSTRISAQEADVKQLRQEFLATIFNRKVMHVNVETGQQEESFYFVSSQCFDNAPYFAGVSDVQFQAILLWWQGMMNYLAKQYPNVFKTTQASAASGVSDDPLKIYTRSTTTMIKYAAASEEEVNRTTYSIILQHINDMAEENERVEEIRKRNKP